MTLYPSRSFILLLLRLRKPSRSSRIRRHPLQPRQARQRLPRARGHKSLQMRALPWPLAPFVRIEIALVTVVISLLPWFRHDALDPFLRPRFLRFRLLFLLRLGAHGRDAIYRSRYTRDCRSVAVLGFILQADIFSVVEMRCESAGDGEEFIFDHYVDVVGVEAGAHEFFSWRRGGWGR